MEAFIPIFEVSLRMNEVPQGEWKKKLTSHVPVGSLVLIEGILGTVDSSYQEVVDGLMGGSTLTFCSAAEDMCSGERGRLGVLDVRTSMTKLKQLVRRVTSDADTREETVECVSVALMRDHLVPQLKSYVDMSRRFKVGEFIAACEEWECSQPRGTQCFRRSRPYQMPQGKTLGGGNTFVNKKPVSCFTCGKQDHMSRECRSRPQAEAVMLRAPAAPTAAEGARGKPGEVVCFRCNGKGHKSPACPTKQKSNKKVQLQERVPQVLQH